MPNLPDQAPNNSALPTRKWIVARVTAIGALAVMWATTGTWDTEETIMAIGIAVEAANSYLTPNRPPVNKPKDYAQV